MQLEPITKMKQLFGKFEIDSSASRASYGIKSHSEFISELNRDAWNISLQAIEKYVTEGNRLASIETKENVVAEISADYNFRDERKEITYKMVDRPSIKYHPAPGQFVDISA